MKHLRKLQLIYWNIFKPKTLGVRAILIKEGEILLVKHSYIDKWYLPGGGMHKKEEPKEALKRELREELGAEPANFKLLGKYYNEQEGKKDTIFCYICANFELGNIDNKEIRDMKFFPLNNLPKDTSPGSKRRILEYIKGI